MRRSLLVTATTGIAILVLGAGVPSGAGSTGALECVTSEITPTALNALVRENGCFGATEDAGVAAAADEGLRPARAIADAYPTFLGIAVDPDNDRVVMADSGRKGLLMYDRTAGLPAAADQVTKPIADLRGDKTEIGFVAGVTLDRARKEKYTINNDGGDKVVVFDYDATGNVAPKRELTVTHQAWGVALNRARDEMAVTIEINNMIEIYGREATGKTKPRRVIKGDKTGLADPHGLSIDNDRDEIFVANHGNWTSMTTFDADASDEKKPGAGGPAAAPRSEGGRPTPKGGRFLWPSIRVFAGAAKGDVAPIRAIEGAKTGLNWPMSLDIDTKNDEIAVANSGDNRVLIFHRSDKGDAAPIRAIGGSNTGLSGPMGVAIDNKNDELWVTNYGDHTALVFSRTATGNVTPKRIVRNAPAGTASVGFGNPGAVAYDSKRDEILVPN
jgi:DNA-binding beta-propeller fold protein YncE